MPVREYEKFLWTLAALFVVVDIGILGYWWIEGWPPFDALYMTVITLFTIGYGETHELSTAGRIFTIFLIFLGVGVVGYGFSQMTAFFVEGSLKDIVRRSRMQGRIDKMRGHFIVCGSGHAGHVIRDELLATKKHIVVVELREEEHQKLVDQGVAVIHGDATKDDILTKAGVERAAGLFAALGNDRDNAFVCLTARGINAKLRIVVEQVDAGTKNTLLRSGADEVVRPSRIGGLRMASVMIRPAVVSFLDSMLKETGEAFRIEELTVPEGSPLAGKPVGEIKGHEGDAALVVAIKANGDYLFNPPAGRELKPGETLVVMGTVSQKEELARRLSS